MSRCAEVSETLTLRMVSRKQSKQYKASLPRGRPVAPREAPVSTHGPSVRARASERREKMLIRPGLAGKVSSARMPSCNTLTLRSGAGLESEKRNTFLAPLGRTANARAGSHSVRRPSVRWRGRSNGQTGPVRTVSGVPNTGWPPTAFRSVWRGQVRLAEKPRPRREGWR